MKPKRQPANDPPFTALGIDVGGTKIAAGIVTFPEGRVHSRRQIATKPERGGDSVLADVVQLATELATDAGTRNCRIDAIGLGMCELVDTEGDIVSASSLAWKSADVRRGLAAIAPAVLEADVRAAALAEAMFGAGKPHRIFIYVTIGTGISCCLVVEGRPFIGAHGATGTMASSPLPRLVEPRDSSPAMTLEQFASGPALVARLNQLYGQAQSGQEVLTAARAGDTGALDVVRSAAEALGAAIGWLVNVLDPEAVVIGGGLGLSEGPYWDGLEAALRRHIWSDLYRDLPIRRAVTGVNAGLIGAAAAAWNKYSAELKGPDSSRHVRLAFKT